MFNVSQKEKNANWQRILDMRAQEEQERSLAKMKAPADARTAAITKAEPSPTQANDKPTLEAVEPNGH